MDLVEAPGRGGEVLGGVLGGHSELEGVAARLGRGGQGEALGDADLLAHQVDARDLFGDGVLDLEARVDLEEPDVAVRLQEEFDGAHADVVHVFEQRAGSGHHLLVRALGQEGGGGLFDQLLVAALHGAVARGDDVEVTQ